MKMRFWWPVLFIWLGPALATLAVQGQPQGQAVPKSGVYNAGPYRLRVTFDRMPLKSAQDFFMTVERLDPPAGAPAWQLEVDGLPNPGTSATPVKIEGNFQTTEPDRKLVKMQLPISGGWNIRLTVKDAAGSWQARVPAQVEPPPVIATWLAWLLGLSPLAGLLGFGLAQWRWVRRRRQAERIEAT